MIESNSGGENMDELRVAVPLASLEGEDWGDFGSYQSSQAPEAATDKCDLGQISTSNSLEDLVNNFDHTLTNCFRDLQQDVQHIAPVQIRSHEEILSENQ